MGGKLSRIIAILKDAPKQIIVAYRKGYTNAPAVPPPEALRKRDNPPAEYPKKRK